MTNAPENPEPEVADDFQQAGSRQPDRREPGQEPRGKRDLAYATDRHIADLTAQRDRLETVMIELQERLLQQSEKITELVGAKERLSATREHLSEVLESERLQRGFIGIVATLLAAVGGGFVGVYEDWRRWLFGSMLFIGCSFMLYNSLINLSEEIRQRGIRGMLKRLWLGKDE